MTRDFATVTYSKDDDDDDLTAAFTISVPGVAPPWGTRRAPGVVHTNCGPQPHHPPFDTSPVESDSDECNKCVFVRYYTIRKRLGIPRVIKAAAGPHNLDPGSPNSGEGSPLEAHSDSGSGSDTTSSPFGDGGDDSGSATSVESEADAVIHNIIPVRSLPFPPGLTRYDTPSAG